jgi:hypothetical protein
MVPVKVELWPEANRAIAEQQAGHGRAGQGREQAVRLLDAGHLGVRPDRWKAEAARIRIAALMNSATARETTVSSVASRRAERLPGSSAGTTRVWTIDECR